MAKRSMPEKRERALSIARMFSEGPLRGAMGWGDEPIKVETPGAGDHSILYFVGPQSASQVMLRLFENRKQCLRYRQALELTTRHRLPTPHLAYCRTNWLDKARYGMRFVATTLAPGKTLDKQSSTAQARQAVAKALARLHGVERPRWGALGWRRRSRSFAENFRVTLARRFRELRAHPSDLSAENFSAITRWFVDRVGVFENLKTFQLCHHHLHRDDILYDPETDIATIIDCVSLQFSRASRDLANMRSNPWMGGERHFRNFLDVYFEHSPPERPGEYEREGELFEAYKVLWQMSKRVLRQGKREPVKLPEADRGPWAVR